MVNQEAEKREEEGAKAEKAEGKGDMWGIGSPLVLPALPRPSARGLLEPCGLWRQRGSSGVWRREDRGCGKTHPASTFPNPSPRTEGGREMVGPRKMGDPVPPQRPDRKAQAEPHHPGDSPTGPPRSTHS